MRNSGSGNGLANTGGKTARTTGLNKSSSQMLEELGAVQTSTGVANIPNQVHYLHSKRKINVNVLLFGESGLGKTGLINHILGQPLFQDAHAAPLSAQASISASLANSAASAPAVEIRVRRQELEEAGSRALLTVVDLPTFGPLHGKKASGQAALQYIEDQFETCLREESKLRRQRASQDAFDSRIHTVLYFHNPTAHKLSNLDVQLIKSMARLANVILVVAKGDTLLRHEFFRIKSNMREQLADVKLFRPEQEAQTPADPFICVSGCDLLAPAPARNYFWGSLKIAPSASPASLSINILTQLLFKDYLPELILGTQSKYDAWKSDIIRRMNVQEDEWNDPAEVLNKIVSKLSELRMTA